MENGLRDRLAVLQVFDNDALEQFWSYSRIPDPFRINDYDRPIGADAEAWCFSALHALRPEQKIFALQQLGEKRIYLPAPPIW